MVQDSDVQPIRFIKNGAELEIKFVDADNNDTLKWYKGVVSNVISFGNDDDGGFIECDIDYDDGEVEKLKRLYDKDFNNENPDSWRIVGNITLLLSLLMKNSEELSDLKKTLYDKDQEVRNIIQNFYEFFKDEDDSEDDDSEEEDPPNKVTYIEVKQNWSLSVLGGVFGGLLFFVVVPHLFRFLDRYQVYHIHLDR